MAAFFHFLLFFLLVVLFFIGITAWRIYDSFRNLSDRLRGNNPGKGNYSSQRSAYGTTQNEEIIIDQRDRSQTGRKIFNDNEGEYVDYEEEK